MTRARQAGVGLVEVVLSAAIALVLIGALLGLVRSALLLSHTSLRQGRLEESGLFLTNRLAKELRWADPETLLVTEENGSSRLDYRYVRDFDGTEVEWSPMISVRYEPVPRDLNENGIADEGEVVRIEDGHREVVARGIPEGGLQMQFAGDRVLLSVQTFTLDGAAGPMESTIQTAVALRNRGL